MRPHKEAWLDRFITPELHVCRGRTRGAWMVENARECLQPAPLTLFHGSYSAQYSMMSEFASRLCYGCWLLKDYVVRSWRRMLAAAFSGPNLVKTAWTGKLRPKPGQKV